MERIDSITLGPKSRADVYDDGHVEIVLSTQVGPDTPSGADFEERVLAVLSAEKWEEVKAQIESGKPGAILLGGSNLE